MTTRLARTRPGYRPEPSALTTELFFASWFSRSRFCLSRRSVDRFAIAAALRSAILHLPYIGHGAEQPDSGCDQHHEKSEQHRVFAGAIALVFRRLRFLLQLLCHRLAHDTGG